MIIRMTIEVFIDDSTSEFSEEEKSWMENDVLVSDGSMQLHSAVADVIGTVHKVEDVNWGA